MKAKYFYLPLAILVLSACTSKRIVVQVLKPAELTLPRTINRIGVTDRSFLGAGASTFCFENGAPSSRFNDLILAGPPKVIDGFLVELSSFTRFETIPLATDEKAPEKPAETPVLSDERMKKWATDSLLDALVSLEGYKVELISAGNIYPSAYTDAFGNVFIVPRFQDSRTIRITAHWRVYDLKRQAVILDKKVSTELFFASNGYNSDDAYRNLPEKRGNVENASQVAGIKFARSFIPVWERGVRKIYLGQLDPWLVAADSAEVGNWESAAEQWTKLEKKAVLGIFRRQAVYNLVVANEVTGNFEEAERWAKIGQKRYKTREFDGAILYIDRRRIENQALDEQLNE